MDFTVADTTTTEAATTTTFSAVREERPAAPTATAAPTGPDPAFAPPDWLGTRLLPLRPDGHAEVLPTPPELTDRRFVIPGTLPPPQGDVFRSTISAVPDRVVARSTWHEGCPVGLDELRYVTVSFWSFDGTTHTGELLINATAAEAVVGVFVRLFDARFPIEEMRITTVDELELPPTGDSNNTESFVCRPAVGSGSWSQHAYGLAIDINPFHNPYAKGDLVIPALSSAYLDRSWVRPGMIGAGDVVTRAFGNIGWGWGGDWVTLKDWQHFSASGR